MLCTLHRSSAAVSVKDSNGTFVSTLSMILYNVSSLPWAAFHILSFSLQFINYESFNYKVRGIFKEN